MNAQKLNFQISLLLSAFQILVEVANTEQRIAAVKSLAQVIVELTSERTGVTSLAKELILRELVSESWMEVSESLDVNLDEVGRWEIFVDRSDLPAGFYSGAVTFFGADDTGNSLSADLYVYLRVGKVGQGNLGSIEIAIRPKKSDEEIVTSSSTAENGYSYKAIVPEAGIYTVIAGTDVDNGGEICGVGDACSTSGGEIPKEIDVTGPLSGIDLVVSLPVEEK